MAGQEIEGDSDLCISKLGSNYLLLLVLPPIIGYYWLLLAINLIIGINLN